MRKSTRLTALAAAPPAARRKAAHRAGAEDRQFVTALARGLDILRAFGASRRHLGNQELAQATGLPKPTVSRLAYTLTRLGYLHYSPLLGKYALGAAMLPVARAYMASLDIPAVARPHMQALADATGATVSLGALERLHMVCLEVCQGGAVLGVRLEAGARVPHGWTAMGRAYLCGVSAAERAEMMADLRRREGKAAVDASIAKALREYQRYGFCLLETQPEVYSVGVPMVSPSDGRTLALSCTGPRHAMSRQRLIADIGPRLVALRDRVLADLDGALAGRTGG